MIPKVSICIPTYCQIAFLRQTLNSIKEQNFTDYEIIISDDSPDNSVQNLLWEFDFGERLHYFKNEIALGSPENWNEAMRKASGLYIKVLHHDDKFTHPGALAAFVNLLDSNPNVDFGFSAARVDDVQSKSIRLNCPTERQLKMLATTPEKLFLGNCIGAPSATIFQRRAIVNYDNRMKWLVDIDQYIRILQRNKNFAYSPQALISTPTNALHQVTELCKNDAEIELYEYALLYLKNAKFFSAEQDVLNFFITRIGKYGLRAVRANIAAFEDDISIKNLLEDMLRIYRKRPLLRLISFLYWRLPVPLFVQRKIQLFIKFSYKFSSSKSKRAGVEENISQ